MVDGGDEPVRADPTPVGEREDGRLVEAAPVSEVDVRELPVTMVKRTP